METDHGFVHDALAFYGGPLAVFDVLLDNPLEIVDVVDVDIVQAVDVRIDVPRYGDIDEKQRPVAPAAHGAPDLVPTDDDSRSPGGANDDIHHLQGLGYFFEPDRPSVKALGQFHPPLEGAVGHPNLVGAIADKMLHGQFRHFASPDQKHLAAFEVAEDLTRQLDGRIADGNRMIPDARFSADSFGHEKGSVQQTV